MNTRKHLAFNHKTEGARPRTHLFNRYRTSRAGLREGARPHAHCLTITDQSSWIKGGGRRPHATDVLYSMSYKKDKGPCYRPSAVMKKERMV